MMARSHVVVGLVAWVAAAPLLQVTAIDPGYLALAVAGSLLPDIDHPKSWVGRRTRPVSTAIASMLGHRGVTHSALAVVVLAMLLMHVGFRHGAVGALAVGYLSHLAADMLTPQGLRLAWPMRGTWSLPVCRTGSAAEQVIVLALTCSLAWWAFRHSAAWSLHEPHWISGWFR
jgi:inner membrane protein